MGNSKNKAMRRQYSILVGDRGRFVLPKEVRDFFGVDAGDTLTIILEKDGSARLVTLKEQVIKVKGLYAQMKPKRLLVDELLQERREETSSG